MVREFDDALIMKIIKETKQFMADCNNFFDKLNDPLTTTEEIANSPLFSIDVTLKPIIVDRLVPTKQIKTFLKTTYKKMEKMIKNDTSLDRERLSVIKQILLKVNSLLYFINNYQGKDNYYSNLSNIDFDKAIHISNMDVKQRDKYFLLKDLLRTNNGTKFKNLVQNDDSFFDLLILFYRDLILNINIYDLTNATYIFNLGLFFSDFFKDNTVNSKKYSDSFNGLRNVIRNKLALIYFDEKKKDELQRIDNEIKNVLKILNQEQKKEKKQIFDFYAENDYDEDEIKKINLAIPNNLNDYREHLVITIDDISSLDLDDAFSLQKDTNGDYLLYVYIADVIRILRRNQNILKIAYKRGTSFYNHDNQDDNFDIHMLPEILATDVLSLVANNERNVQAFFFRISPLGEIKNFEISKGVILVKERCDYDQVNVRLENGKKDNDIDIMLNNAKELADVLSSKHNSQLSLTTNNNEDSNSFAIIRELAILVNTMVAKVFSDYHYPFLYRNIKENDSYAYYSSHNDGHHLLGVSAYGHCTSPIRRFSDVINQELIEKFLIDKNVPDTDWQNYLNLVNNAGPYLTKRNNKVLKLDI